MREIPGTICPKCSSTLYDLGGMLQYDYTCIVCKMGFYSSQSRYAEEGIPLGYEELYILRGAQIKQAKEYLVGVMKEYKVECPEETWHDELTSYTKIIELVDEIKSAECVAGWM